jgi:hypothetical protein
MMSTFNLFLEQTSDKSGISSIQRTLSLNFI